MALNRLSTKNQRSRANRSVSADYRRDKLELEDNCHEATEVSLCDEGMCFSSPVKHEIGTLLLVDFQLDSPEGDSSMRSESVVVDCAASTNGSGYEITVLFTGN